MPMDQDQEVVETGLAGMQVPEPTPSVEPVTIQGLEDDLTVKVAEVNQPAVVLAAATRAEMETGAATLQANYRGGPTTEQPFTKDLQEQAENENMQRNFMLSMQQAQRPEVKPYTPPEVPKQIAETTRLEMEAGRKRVAEFAALEQARVRIVPQHDPSAGKTVPVFRPADWVPDQRKGEGHVAGNSARPL